MDVDGLEEWLLGYATSDLAQQSDRRTPAGSQSARLADPAMLQRMLDVVDRADELDVKRIFAQPVTEGVAPGYFSIIAHPVDLRTVR
jgi:hypothetical protein